MVLTLIMLTIVLSLTSLCIYFTYLFIFCFAGIACQIITLLLGYSAVSEPSPHLFYSYHHITVISGFCRRISKNTYMYIDEDELLTEHAVRTEIGF